MKNSDTAEKRCRNHSGKKNHQSEKPDLPLAIKMPPEKEVESADGISDRRKYLAVAVLFLINLLNYMDRFTIAGMQRNLGKLFLYVISILVLSWLPSDPLQHCLCAQQLVANCIFFKCNDQILKFPHH